MRRATKMEKVKVSRSTFSEGKAGNLLGGRSDEITPEVMKMLLATV